MDHGASDLYDQDELRRVVAALNVQESADSPQVRPAAANADWAVRLLDLKGTARPPTFDGKDVSWPDFKFKFEATAELLHMAWGQPLTAILRRTKKSCKFSQQVNKEKQKKPTSPQGKPEKPNKSARKNRKTQKSHKS